MASGYVMKTNARIGRSCATASCLIWATCNDEEALRKFRNGALWSRFPHRLHCRRPSPELLRRIVAERALALGLPVGCADLAFEFAQKTWPAETGAGPLDDPRQVLALLDGGERLLDGSYQADLLEIYDGDSPAQGAGGGFSP
jgi:hypothetical protein